MMAVSATSQSSADRVVALPGGRRLALVEHGDPQGRAVFVFHGTPASRLGHEFLDDAARALHLRVICPDRPGIGRSDPKPDRTIAGWSDDVNALAGVLGIDRFAVLGYSGGGPYAIACGAGCGDRIVSVATMAGAGPPYDRPGATDGMSPTDLRLTKASLHHPWIAALSLRVMKLGARLAPGFGVAQFERELSEPDRVAMAGQDRRWMTELFIESLRQGPHGVMLDYRLWAEPWGIDWSAVTVPVHLFQGDADQIVPMHQAEDMAGRLPNAHLHRMPGVGHVSIQEHAGQLLETLTAAFG